MTDLEREAWLIAARQVFTPGERSECFVCGKFKSITQAHHVVPLTAQYDRAFKVPDNEHVWLCPNHHAMAHIVILGDDRSMTERALRSRHKSAASLNQDLSDDEFEKILDLMRRATRGPA